MLHLENEIKPYYVDSAADVIKETMKYYHVKQSDLASRLGVSQKYISDVLSRKEYINVNIALRIQDVMGLSSKLLLNMDSSFKLHYAKIHSNYRKGNNVNKNRNYLKKYIWA